MINLGRFENCFLNVKKIQSMSKATSHKAPAQAPAPIVNPAVPTQEQLDEAAKKSDEQSAEAALKFSTGGSSERPTEDANLPHDAEVLKNYNQTGVDETDTGFGKLDADQGQPQQQ